MIIITEEQLNLFMSLFRGRVDVFARRWEKNGKSGYTPAYKFDWNEYLLFKAKGGHSLIEPSFLSDAIVSLYL